MATPIATEYSTDTILGMLNQYHAMLGKGNLNYQYMPNTTLNSKYSCFAPVESSDGTWLNIPRDANNSPVAPTIGYFGIGIRGFYNITADDDISPLSQPYSPKATDMDLYRPIPIRCIPKEYDLTAAERTKYRLRTEIPIDGNTYVCYWLKRLEFDDDISITQIDGSGNETPYVIEDNIANLTPTPVAPTTPSVITGSSKVIISANIKCEIEGKEVLEAINTIYHGDLRRARISEWGIYTGGDMTVTNVDGLSYTEAMYVQLAAKRCTTGVDMSNSSAVQQEILTIQNGNLLLLN